MIKGKMFAGLMGLDSHLNHLHHRCEGTEAANGDTVFDLRASFIKGGKASGTAGSSGRKKLHRRPGYMRGEQARLQCIAHEQEEEEEENIPCIRNGKSGRHADITEATRVHQLSRAPTVKVSLINNQHYKRSTCSASNNKNLFCSVNGVQKTPSHLVQSSPSLNELSPSLRSLPEVSFNSSFSFIQQSINCNQKTDQAVQVKKPEPTSQPANLEKKREGNSGKHIFLKQSTPAQSLPSLAQGSQVHQGDHSYSERCWRDCLWGGKEETSHIPSSESQSLDIEVTSSLSVDSDTASASSVTSGYESATPASEQSWDSLVKKYEGVLQDCLQNNRTYAKIESMMLKLQRLQQKAILDDDYDAAERFGKKLEELCSERGALKLGLPSRQPSVALFLETLAKVVHSALQRADWSHRREGSEPVSVEQLDPLQRRDHLIQEKCQVEEEIEELQARLAQLKDHSRCLERLIFQEEQRAEAVELEGSVLRICTLAQLQDMSQTLQDLITSENRTQISISPPPSTLRLQQEEQALNLSIKEATAKVVMSQRLGSSLRRKVSETETQLLALHEAKLAAISGNDFGCAKELKAEMKAVYLERDRLEALAKRLHSLSSGSSQELARMKEQRQQLRQELEQREALHETRLKENTTKYLELLEDRLQSCGCPGLERIWEADLEACHLFLQGLQLRTPSCGGTDMEDLPDPAVYPSTQPCTKEEEDCAMLTALGGRWCPEANLQNSEFTKKLEEFLFCMEENHPEDVCSEADATDLTERCELISDRLIALEDKLQTAILNRDQALTQCLEKEVQEVKSTLQSMLANLKMEEHEEEEARVLDELIKDEAQVKVEEDDDDDEEEEEEEEEEEDQYFSDSWDI